MGTGTGRENLRCKVAELVFRDLQGAERGTGKVVGDEVRVIVACLGGEVHIVIRTLVFARSEIGMLWTGVRRGVVQADLGS